MPPLAVAFPRAVDDLDVILAVCRAEGVPLTARGGGTSVAGNAVGPGVVVDASRHLTRILDLDPEARTARVEPGVVLADLQRAAAAFDLRVGPDPSTAERCTIGGMVGTNACGTRSLRYGRTSDTVVGLDVVTGAGERLLLGGAGQPRHAGSGGSGMAADPGARSGSASASPALGGLRDLAARHDGAIRTWLGRFPRQVSGYALEHLLPEAGFDVARALVGSEGTLALVRGVALRLVPEPAATALVVLGYADMASAADAVPTLLTHEPVAIEGLDRRIVDAVRSRRGARTARSTGGVPDLPRGGGWLLVEVAGATSAAVAHAGRALLRDADALEGRLVTDPAEGAALWRIRADGAGWSGRTAAGVAAHSGWEDAAVPPERLGAYLREFEALLADHGLTAMPYGHFGEGCLHVRIDFPLSRPEGPGAFRRFLVEAAVLVASHGGSLSGEHGDGRARSALLGLLYPPAILTAFAECKALLDPDGVLNPGVLVGARPVDADLRVPAARPLREGLAFAYAEDGGDLTTAVHRCTGVGSCRADTAVSGGVMCPSFQATGDERDTTRGRARVLQELVSGDSLLDGFRAAEVHDALDLCLSCRACASDCPTGVDMATYKAEVLHQAHRGRLRPLSHHAIGRLPRWLRLAGSAPEFANRLAAQPIVAAVIRAVADLDERRPIPAVAPQRFSALRVARASRATTTWSGAVTGPEGRQPVVLWVDTFTERVAPQVAVAALRVLDAAGFAVRIAAPDRCCGLTLIATGQLGAARAELRGTVDALDALDACDVRGGRRADGVVADGIPILALEPSCAAVLRTDAPALLGPHDRAAAAVAARTHTLADLLARYRPDWAPPPLHGTHVVAQPHCHHHAVFGWEADAALLGRAGAAVARVSGCCGLAGSWGMARGHHDVSVAIAEHALLPAVRAASPEAVLLADGMSCRVQLDQLANRRAQHLAELLAQGLPEG